MSRPRLLTDHDEIAASDAFKRLLADSGKSQEQVASEVGEGVSQGTVWQWANRRLAIPANRAVDVARAVNGDPHEISVAFRVARAMYSGQPAGAAGAVREKNSDYSGESHRTGFPLATLADAMTLVRLFVQDKELPAEALHDPLLLKNAIDVVSESKEGVSLSNVIELKKKLAGRLPKGMHATTPGTAKKAG